MTINPSASSPSRAVSAPVLGVHRSGTSVLTALIQALGVPIGDISKAQSKENPKGFFESQMVQKLNEDLLAYLDASWDNWSFDAGSVPFAADHFSMFRSRAAQVLNILFGDAALWSVKDPRMTTLWPFWRLVIGAQATIRPIIIIRQPREVAASQLKRSMDNPGFHGQLAHPEDVAALWCFAMINVLEDIGGETALVIDHQSLISKPESGIEKLSTFLMIKQWSDAEVFARSFVERELYRSRDLFYDGPWMALAERLFGQIAEAAGAAGTLSQEAARQVARSQSQLQGIRPFMDGARRAVWRAKTCTNETNAALAKVAEERDRADRFAGDVADLARQLAQTVQEAGARETDLRSQIARAQEAAALEKAHLAALTAEMEALKSRPFWRRLRG